MRRRPRAAELRVRRRVRPSAATVATWARTELTGFTGFNALGVDAGDIFKDPMHLFRLTCVRTRFLRVVGLFHQLGLSAQLQEHLTLLKLRPRVYFPHDGPPDISLRGDSVRRLIEVGGALFDPSSASMSDLGLEPIQLEEGVNSLWLSADVARVLGDWWGRHMLFLERALTTSWDRYETETMPNYFDDVHYLLEFERQVLGGSLTPTERSQREIGLSNAIVAYQLGYPLGLFGADGGENKHLVQRRLVSMRAGGGRAGATKHERAELALQYIIVMEKYEEGLVESLGFDTVLRTLATLEAESPMTLASTRAGAFRAGATCRRSVSSRQSRWRRCRRRSTSTRPRLLLPPSSPRRRAAKTTERGPRHRTRSLAARPAAARPVAHSPCRQLRAWRAARPTRSRRGKAAA